MRRNARRTDGSLGLQLAPSGSTITSVGRDVVVTEPVAHVQQRRTAIGMPRAAAERDSGRPSIRRPIWTSCWAVRRDLADFLEV